MKALIKSFDNFIAYLFDAYWSWLFVLTAAIAAAFMAKFLIITMCLFGVLILLLAIASSQFVYCNDVIMIRLKLKELDKMFKFIQHRYLDFESKNSDAYKRYTKLIMALNRIRGSYETILSSYDQTKDAVGIYDQVDTTIKEVIKNIKRLGSYHDGIKGMNCKGESLVCDINGIADLLESVVTDDTKKKSKSSIDDARENLAQTLELLKTVDRRIESKYEAEFSQEQKEGE